MNVKFKKKPHFENLGCKKNYIFYLLNIFVCMILKKLCITIYMPFTVNKYLITLNKYVMFSTYILYINDINT